MLKTPSPVSFLLFRFFSCTKRNLIAHGAMIEGAEGAMEEASGGALLSTAVVVKGEGDGVGLGDGCRFLGCSLMPLWRFISGVEFLDEELGLRSNIGVTICKRTGAKRPKLQDYSLFIGSIPS